MDRIENIKNLLNTIRSSEGSGFTCDEGKILANYHTKEGEKASLAIKILSVLGGILASAAFIVVLFLLDVLDSEWSSMVLGILLIGTAIGINKKYETLIIDTFSVSIYVLGFVLFILGMAMHHNVQEEHVAFLIVLIALSSLFFTQNYVISFISVLAIGAAFLFLIISYNIPDAIHGYVLFYTIALSYCFLNEASLLTAHPKLAKLYGPLRIGLMFSLLFGLVAIGKNGLVPISKNLIWMSSVASFFFILYLASYVLRTLQVRSTKNKLVAYVLCFLILLPTLFAPAISGAMLIVLLGFLVNHKTGFGVGIVALVYFVSQYYYDLNLSLLTKSIVLFSSGVVFLVFYLFFTKKTKTHEKV